MCIRCQTLGTESQIETQTPRHRGVCIIFCEENIKYFFRRQWDDPEVGFLEANIRAQQKNCRFGHWGGLGSVLTIPCVTWDKLLPILLVILSLLEPHCLCAHLCSLPQFSVYKWGYFIGLL